MPSNRRFFIGSTALSIFGVLPFKGSSRTGLVSPNDVFKDGEVGPYYPSTSLADLREVVGAAHTQFDRVKELVQARPELAKASFDWGFGDVETALGAASHMGRKDIAELLIEYGARPDIYTFAMLGKLNAVQSMIEDMPGIQRIAGPHGFSLLFHARMRLRRENVEGQEKKQQEELVKFLESLGDADPRAQSLDISEEEQKSYMGKYAFGDNDDEYFEVTLNSRGSLYMSRGEYIGRVLNRVDNHIFAPSGGPSVRISFEMVDGQAASLTIHDPSPILTAHRA